MTAPGDDVLTLLLLALFLVSTGYAAGRLHQWYRMGTDRDEAYRDGYDTATRSVFSMAVRLIGPRRPVRATATVIPGTVTTPRPDLAADAGMPAAAIAGASEAAPANDAPTHRLTPARIARATTRPTSHTTTRAATRVAAHEPGAPLPGASTPGAPLPGEETVRTIPRPRTP